MPVRFWAASGVEKLYVLELLLLAVHWCSCWYCWYKCTLWLKREICLMAQSNPEWTCWACWNNHIPLISLWLREDACLLAKSNIRIHELTLKSITQFGQFWAYKRSVSYVPEQKAIERVGRYRSIKPYGQFLKRGVWLPFYSRNYRPPENGKWRHESNVNNGSACRIILIEFNLTSWRHI